MVNTWPGPRLRPVQLSERTSSYLAKGPQQPPVGHRDDAEGHGEAEDKVQERVGDVTAVSALPLGGAGDADTLRLVVAPAEERRRVPEKGPEPGEQQAAHRMSAAAAGDRFTSWTVDRTRTSATPQAPGTWSGTGLRPLGCTLQRSARQR